MARLLLPVGICPVFCKEAPGHVGHLFVAQNVPKAVSCHDEDVIFLNVMQSEVKYVHLESTGVNQRAFSRVKTPGIHQGFSCFPYCTWLWEASNTSVILWLPCVRVITDCKTPPSR